MSNLVGKYNQFGKNPNPVNEAAVTVGGKLVTPKTLPASVVKTINERIGDEYAAHYFYRNAANWCKDKNYKKAAAFFEVEANTELEHAKGLQDYVTQWNELPAIPPAPTEVKFESLVDIVNGAYEMEYNLFQNYSDFQTDLLTVHPATFNFIQGYLNGQNESVAEYCDLINALELVDIDNRLDILYFENQYFG
jgi:ferritin